MPSNCTFSKQVVISRIGIYLYFTAPVSNSLVPIGPEENVQAIDIISAAIAYRYAGLIKTVLAINIIAAAVAIGAFANWEIIAGLAETRHA